MKIGNLNLAGQVLAAPLAGVSNRPYRVISVRQGASMVYTEMISSEGIIRHQKKTMAMANFKSDEQPLGIQLFGSTPEVMGEAAAIIEKVARPDLIDINFGCPVKKVVNKNGGAAVLKDLKLTEEIIAAVVAGASETPVTIKIRTGWDEDHPVFIEAGEAAERAGAKAITLHARSRAKGFSGQADWTSIKALKEAVGIVVIGNGDVNSPEDARRMLDETGCDGVMIGRAAMGDPFVFGRMETFLKTGKLPPEPTVADKVEMARLHAKLLVEEVGEERGVRMMRKHFGWYFKGFPKASELRKVLMRTTTLAELDIALKTELGLEFASV